MKIHRGCDFPKESLIAGSFIDTSVCDAIIEFFNSGIVKPRRGFYTGQYFINERIKDSLDITIKKYCDTEPFKSYEVELDKVLSIYKDIYKLDEHLYYFGLDDYNVQYYKKSEGFYKEHIENTGNLKTVKRCLVFMTYLNSLEDGGTVFANQGITTVAEKGLTLIFPAYYTHLHKGQISTTNEKYIVTGWYSFLNEE